MLNYCLMNIYYCLSIIITNFDKNIIMKKEILFKTLIDILFFIHVLAFFGLLLVLPLKITGVNIESISKNNLTFYFWSVLIITIFSSFLFLKGLYFLRKVARFLLLNKFFTIEIIKNLKKVGTSFVYASCANLFLLFIHWIGKLNEGLFILKFDDNLITPFFMLIMGLFFIVQSKFLLTS